MCRSRRCSGRRSSRGGSWPGDVVCTGVRGCPCITNVPPMTTPARAAIYARISSDVDGTRAGVERQLADCHKRAASLGWKVAAEYVDNDISAYSGKPRPDYERMLA